MINHKHAIFRNSDPNYEKTVVAIFFLLATALATIVNTRKNRLSFLQTLGISSPTIPP